MKFVLNHKTIKLDRSLRLEGENCSHVYCKYCEDICPAAGLRYGYISSMVKIYCDSFKCGMV